MTTVDLEAMTLKQLEETARALDISGRSKMDKEELIEAIEKQEPDDAVTTMLAPDEPVSHLAREGALGHTQIQSLLLGIRETIASVKSQLDTLERLFEMRGVQMTETPVPTEPAPPEVPGPEPAGPQPSPDPPPPSGPDVPQPAEQSEPAE